MDTSLPSTIASPGAAVACPVCGRPAQAALLNKLIARVFCRRCHAVWQIASACH